MPHRSGVGGRDQGRRAAKRITSGRRNDVDLAENKDNKIGWKATGSERGKRVE